MMQQSVQTDLSHSAKALAWARVLDFDTALLKRVRGWELAPVTWLMRGATRVGDTSSWVLFGLLLFAVGGVAQRFAVLLSCGACIATLMTQALKRTCQRTRPSHRICGFVALVDNPDMFSFPSGHTAVAVSVAIALAGQGSALGLLMGLIAFCVGISRVYLGAHYPLDVTAGALLGVLSGNLARAMVL